MHSHFIFVAWGRRGPDPPSRPLPASRSRTPSLGRGSARPKARSHLPARARACGTADDGPGAGKHGIAPTSENQSGKKGLTVFDKVTFVISDIVYLADCTLMRINERLKILGKMFRHNFANYFYHIFYVLFIKFIPFAMGCLISNIS